MNWEGEHKNSSLGLYFSLDVPDDAVVPARVEIAKEVVPICVRLEPPTEAMLQNQGIELQRYESEDDNRDPASLPLLA